MKSYTDMVQLYDMKQVILKYRTIIQKDGDSYHGFVPMLPGCHTQGSTVEETQENLREAIIGYLQTLQSRGESIPKEDGIESVELFDLSKIFSSTKNIRYA